MARVSLFQEANGTFFRDKKLKKNQIVIVKKGSGFKVGSCPCTVEYCSKIYFIKEIINKKKYKKKYREKVEKGKIIMVGTVEETRDRSRSRDNDKNEKKEEIKEEKKFDEAQEKWIKLSAAMPEGEREKFLKLMGVKNFKSGDDDLIAAAKTRDNYKKIDKDLEENFEKSQKTRENYRKKIGLGFKNRHK